MSENDLVILVVLAAAAGFLLLKLRNVLGERTGFENPDRVLKPDSQAGGGDESVVTPFPGRDRARDDSDIFAFAEPDSPLGQSLKKIKNLDAEFNTHAFVDGAKAAYEMLLTAFEAGDKATLKPYLSSEVFTAFSEAIDDRLSRGLSVEMRFIGFRSAEPVEATLDEATREAEISVKFVAEIITATRNAQGEIVEGDPAAVRKITDVWTFTRDLGRSDPNWILVATGG